MRPHALPRAAIFAAAVLALATASLAAQNEEERVVAVLRYDNNSGDDQYDHLGRAFSSMMISDLSVIERVRFVERERLEELLDELDLQQSGYADPEAAVTVGLIVGAEYLVTGAFITVDPEIRMDTRVANVATTEIVATADVTGQKESLFDLQQRLADQVVLGLELALTEEEQRLLRERQEANRIDDMATMVRFSEALCLLDYGAYVEGLDAIQDVQRSAPGSLIVRATVGLLRDKAEEEGRTRLRGEANRRIGGLLGRRSTPERPSRPAQC